MVSGDCGVRCALGMHCIEIGSWKVLVWQSVAEMRSIASLGSSKRMK